MNRYIFSSCCFLFVLISKSSAECEKECNLPINIYEHFKCTPKYEHPSDCCPRAYDCSNIFNHPEGMCHLRGKLYKAGEAVTTDEIAESCHNNCICGEDSQFKCHPSPKRCREYYTPDYPNKGCYLQYPLDSCCSSNEVCPPFDNVTKCNVSGTLYKEGQRFPHPLQKCTKCVCSKDFNGKFSAPDCQRRNCTTEIRYSKEISKYCAPYYIGGTCCPTWWVCPTESGEYVPAPKIENPGLQCRFGDRMMDIGSKYLYQSEYLTKSVCECIVPPFLTCFEQRY